MKRMIPALGAALFALALPAQGDVGKQAGLDALAAEWKTANTEYRAAVQKVQQSEAYVKARKDRDTGAMRTMFNGLDRPDAAAFGKRALLLADALEGEDGLAVLAFAAANLNDKDTFAGVVERVSQRYLTSAKLGSVLSNGMSLARQLGNDEIDALLGKVVDQNPNDEPKAWAKYWQSVMIDRDRDASAEAKARSRTLLTEAEELAGDSLLGDRIRAPQFEKERLQIGMEAPDIEGVDTDGVAFKLSDYRGKVVVLDFWGFW